MFESFIKQIKEWSINESFIDAMILIGSYARGTQKVDSDIDFVVLTSYKQHYIDNPKLFSVFGNIDRFDIEFYGECTSVRVWYKSGLEVEFGMVSLQWLDVPLDAGTKRALSDGYKILMDKTNIFKPITSIIPECAN